MKSVVVSLVILAMCGSAMAGVVGESIDYPLELYCLPSYGGILEQIDDSITIRGLFAFTAYCFAVGDPGSDDITLTASITWTNKTELEFSVRADINTYSMYTFTLSPFDNNLTILKIADVCNITQLASYDMNNVPGFTFEYNKSYGMSFSVQGNTLSGRMWDGNTLLKELTATDSEYTTGLAGVFALNRSDLIYGSWEKIPEPATLSLLSVGALSLLKRRK